MVGIQVRLAVDEDIRAQIGVSRLFDLADLSQAKYRFYLPEDCSFSNLQRHVEGIVRVPALQQRFWTIVYRQNMTYRPKAPVQMKGYELIKDMANSQMILELYLEVSADAALPCLNNSYILFIKLFTPEPPPIGGRLRYGGHLVVSRSTTVRDLVPRIVQLLQMPEGTNLKVWEEVKECPVALVDALRPGDTLARSQLGNGDILVVQATPLPDAASQAEYRDGRDFLLQAAAVGQAQFLHQAREVVGAGLQQSMAAQQQLQQQQLEESQQQQQRVFDGDADACRSLTALELNAAVAKLEEEAARVRRLAVQREIDEAQAALRARLLVLEGDTDACRGLSAEELEAAVGGLEQGAGRLRRLAVARRVDEATAAVNACAVCLERAKDTRLSCGHLLCEACSQLVQDCPVCRQRITSRHRAFL